MNSVITTVNPFHRKDSAYSSPRFTYSGKPLFSHRGVDIYKNSAGSWDYVLNGVTITQRAGFTPDRATQIINEMLDGISPHCDAVAQHLIDSNHKGYTYSQYIADWAAGKVA